MPRPEIESAPETQRASAQGPQGNWLECHGGALRRYLRVLGCAIDRIEDVLQESLLVALRSELTAKSDAQTRSFLRQTAKNVLRNQLRSDRRRREVEIADEVWQQQCEPDDGQGYLAALQQCLAALPERQRQIVHSAYEDDLGRRELATQLGMRPEGIKTALRRLRAQLRECVERKRERS